MTVIRSERAVDAKRTDNAPHQQRYSSGCDHFATVHAAPTATGGMLLHARQVKLHVQSATLPPAAVILNNNENTKEATAKITRQPKIVSAHLVVCKRARAGRTPDALASWNEPEGWRYMAEKVVHNPDIFACYAHGRTGWIWEQVRLCARASGMCTDESPRYDRQSLRNMTRIDVKCTSPPTLVRVTLPNGEEYTYRKVRVAVREFACALNEPAPLDEHFPLSDTRRRPDIHLVESGNFKKANEVKDALEHRQRKRRVDEQKSNAIEHCPRWFTPTYPSDEIVLQ
ncbi:unnamed protein product, partial [Sphagnum balticum]